MCSSQRSQAFGLATTTGRLQVGGGYTDYKCNHSGTEPQKKQNKKIYAHVNEHHWRKANHV